jgi:4-amino-4-deoxy-L-arabinose transferase-like glycosyltransferase
VNYTRKVLILIVASTALRLLFANALELGPDEVYYWTYAQKLQWSYFDHPPIIAWLIRSTTCNLAFHSELAVRIGAIVCSSICTWLFFVLGTLIYNQRAGWFAAFLYTSSVYCSIAAGSFILPDSPQLIFWFIAVILLVKISRVTDNVQSANLLWSLFGLIAGLCIMCKVHGVFLWFAALLYLLIIDRKWLKHKGVYLAAIITLIVVSPIILWNMQHNFITYQFHSGRLTPGNSDVDIKGFFNALLQQVFGSNPVNFFLIIGGLWLALKRKLPIEQKEFKILLLCALPLILTVTIISIFRETLVHWAGPAYSCLLILPALGLASSEKIKMRNFPTVIILALSYIVIASTFEVLITNYFPGTLSPEKQGQKTGLKDVTLDIYGWCEIGTKFDSLYKSDVVNKVMPANARVIVTDWATAAAIEFYVTHKTRQEVYGIGNAADLHQYYLTNTGKAPLKAGENAYYIVPSNVFYYRTSNEVFRAFKDHEVLKVITQLRSGLVCRFITIYRMVGYKGVR